MKQYTICIGACQDCPFYVNVGECLCTKHDNRVLRSRKLSDSPEPIAIPEWCGLEEAEQE